tara:strand:- start:815 stop:1516 length:702 start_codon:yes stop_codon:yes gene_type:complete
MLKKKTNIIAFIPAKKNSQDLKDKNLKKLKNFSLFELALLGAQKSKFINEVYLSSDSNLILKKGKKYEVNLIKRKKSLSNNHASANLVILDFIKNNLKNYKENNIIVYLQPTSPFRNHLHIDEAINNFIKKKMRYLLSVNKNKNFYKSLYQKKNTLSPFFNNKFISENRQNLKNIYSPNGAIYIFYASDFIKNKGLTFLKSGYYIMNDIESIDIDNKQDYELAKFLSKKYLKI